MLDITHGLFAISVAKEIEMKSMTGYHSNFFTQQNLNIILQSQGFKRIRTTNPSGHFRAYYSIYE